MREGKVTNLFTNWFQPSFFKLKSHFHNLDSPSDVEQKVSPGSEVINPASSKNAGNVIAALGCRGLGLLRLEDAFRGSQSLAIQGLEGVTVEAVRPDWWPVEWFQEHQQHNTAVL